MLMTTEVPDEAYRLALLRAVEAKEWLEKLRAKLDLAQAEYDQACLALREAVENMPS
jgi:hypothetical protein